MNVQPTATGTGNFGNKMYLPSAYVKPGELHLQINHDSTVQIPMTSLPETITIRFGPAVSVQETATCLAWMKSYELEGELDGKALIANVVIVITDVLDNAYDSTGAVQITNAS